MERRLFTKEFRVGEIFEQLRGKESAPNRVLPGDIPLINEISTNNGISKKASVSKIFKKNAITISVNYAQNVFYQPEDFGASVNIIILTNPHINELSGLYFTSLIRKVNQKYDYAHKISKDRLNNEIISVPIKPKIDFAAIREVIFAGGVSMLDKIDTSSWMEFKITEVFNVHYGNKFDKNKMTFTNPTINFVSRTGNNNGVSCVVDNNGCAPFPEGFLTLALGGSIGSCFVQQKPFYTGQNVAVLEPIHKISNETALFLSECIMKKCKIMYKAFSDEINKHLKTDLTIKLPVLSATDENYSAGDIDYELMESIIRELEEERIRELEVYLQVTGLNDTTLTPEEEQALRLGPGGGKK